MKLDGLKYRDIIKIIGAYKMEYQEILGSFSCYQIKLQNQYIRNMKNYIYYKLGLSEEQANAIWEYMHDDIDFFDLLLRNRSWLK